MSFLTIYTIFAYLFILGMLLNIPEDERFGEKSTKYIVGFIFSPIVLPIILGALVYTNFKVLKNHLNQK